MVYTYSDQNFVFLFNSSLTRLLLNWTRVKIGNYYKHLIIFCLFFFWMLVDYSKVLWISTKLGKEFVRITYDFLLKPLLNFKVNLNINYYSVYHEYNYQKLLLLYYIANLFKIFNNKNINYVFACVMFHSSFYCAGLRGNMSLKFIRITASQNWRNPVKVHSISTRALISLSA